MAKTLATYHTAIIGDEVVYIRVFNELEQGQKSHVIFIYVIHI